MSLCKCGALPQTQSCRCGPTSSEHSAPFPSLIGAVFFHPCTLSGVSTASHSVQPVACGNCCYHLPQAPVQLTFSDPHVDGVTCFTKVQKVLTHPC